MVVTKIEQKTNTKYRVYVDGQFAFVLYKGELFRYQIREDGELSEADYAKIRKEIVLKRAKLRAMHLLTDMDRTKEQLVKKLRGDEYTEDVIDEAISYVESFGYIDDARYASRFIESKKRTKSKREIRALLAQKGLSSETIDQAMEECYEQGDSEEAIRAVLRKKKYVPGETSEADLRKIYAALARKGFAYEDIRQVIQLSERNA